MSLLERLLSNTENRCDICGRKFSTRVPAIVHLRGSKTKERPGIANCIVACREAADDLSESSSREIFTRLCSRKNAFDCPKPRRYVPTAAKQQQPSMADIPKTSFLFSRSTDLSRSASSTELKRPQLIMQTSLPRSSETPLVEDEPEDSDFQFFDRYDDRTPAPQLLALKAFYLGHAIADSAARRTSAIGPIDRAIAHFSQDQSKKNALWLVFFLILRAEILRHTGDPVPDRTRAKQLCEANGLNLFDCFMQIESGTQSTKTAGNPWFNTVRDSVIRRTKFSLTKEGPSYTDLARRAAGVEDGTLSDWEHWFLEKATLADLLEQQGVSSAA
jgi:hypothetical protein